MTGRHATRVVAEPVALAVLEQMLDSSQGTDQRTARARNAEHRRRAITWSTTTHPEAAGKVFVPAIAGAACWAHDPTGSELVCMRRPGHRLRHMATRLAAPGTLVEVLAVWSGGAR